MPFRDPVPASAQSLQCRPRRQAPAATCRQTALLQPPSQRIRHSRRGIRACRTAVQACGLWLCVTSCLCRTALAQTDTAADAQFVDVAVARGLVFQHHSPFTPQRHLHLTMGSGVAWLDIDRDSWPDLYLAQGQTWTPPGTPPASSPLPHCLLRNRRGYFSDITAAAGVANFDYGMGVLAGDVDNDGFTDVLVTSFGHNQLYLNNGDGTLRRVDTAISSPAWSYSASATWTDLDADGSLDVYITNYLTIDPDNYTLCSQTHREQTVAVPCPPRKYAWPADSLYRNTGTGQFVDESLSCGVQQLPPSPGLGVLTADLNDDGALDLYVANDTTANFLLLNDGKAHYTDQAVVAGAAFNRLGEGEAGMGVACGDVDGDGRLDLFVVNYYGESNTLYRNEGRGLFLDVTAEFALAAPSRTRLGFGTLLTDFNNDGWLDIFVANGHLVDQLEAIGMNIPFRQQPQLLQNDGGQRFRDRSTAAGPYFGRKLLGRGCAAADFDRDGRTDLVVQHLQEQAGLLHNRTTSAGHALQLELIGTAGNRDAIGARVTVVTPDRTLVRQRDSGISYLSCSEARLTIGIGTATIATAVEVRWPSGRVEWWPQLAADTPITLVEGRGNAGSRP